MGLFHQHKFGPVKGDNFQYCSQCGVAKVAPNPCQNGHLWTRGQSSIVSSIYGRQQKVVNLICSRCGIHTQFNETTGVYTPKIS